jgi:hypothetical protein
MRQWILSIACVSTLLSSSARAGVHVAESASPIVAISTVQSAEAPALTREQARAFLLQQREQHLEMFATYRLAKSYPSNTYTSSMANVWRDEQGHPCAVANLVLQSGNQALFQSIANDNNAFRVADIRLAIEDSAVANWVLTSGFTQAELALIQRPFAPVAQHRRPKPSVPSGNVASVRIDAAKKAKDTNRLAKLYAKIDAKLQRDSQASIDAAVDELMKHPELATQRFATAPRS